MDSIKVFRSLPWKHCTSLRASRQTTRTHCRELKSQKDYGVALSSLVDARAGNRREEFHLDEISEADTQYVLDQITDIFTRDGQGSGIDWGSVTQVIIDRYAGRLELLRIQWSLHGVLLPGTPYRTP